jgi:hypothetical protein
MKTTSDLRPNQIGLFDSIFYVVNSTDARQKPFITAYYDMAMNKALDMLDQQIDYASDQMMMFLSDRLGQDYPPSTKCTVQIWANDNDLLTLSKQLNYEA